jgi:two-component system, NtrC family, response regulator GlrR
LLLPLAMPDGLDGIRILLVDDDEDLLAVMQVILESDGALVTPTSSVDAALAELATTRPDVLVLDIIMPGRDGWSLLSEARGRGALDGVSVLIVTGLELKPQQIADAGVNGYLPKPMDAKTLCATVEGLLRARQRPSV